MPSTLVADTCLVQRREKEEGKQRPLLLLVPAENLPPLAFPSFSLDPGGYWDVTVQMLAFPQLVQCTPRMREFFTPLWWSLTFALSCQNLLWPGWEGEAGSTSMFPGSWRPPLCLTSSRREKGPSSLCQPQSLRRRHLAKHFTVVSLPFSQWIY